MKLAVIGATGRTGAHLLPAALDRGHQLTVLVRNPDKLDRATRQPVRVVVGEATDSAALTNLLTGVDAVVSVLGPTAQKERDLQARTARALIGIMSASGPRRFVGLSAAGVDVPGDRKAPKDKVLSRLIMTFGGPVAKDKPAEYRAWSASTLDWTLVRPPRLVDGPHTPGPLEHDAHRSTRSMTITRADLAAFLLDVVEQGLYLRQAPFVAAGSR